MNDEMDVYLGRCLKNWAASQPPPEDRRAELLKTARNEVNSRSRYSLFLYWFTQTFQSPPVFQRSGEWFPGPFTQSRLWSVHLATDSRLAV